jgi:hypothetical protein
VASSSLECQSSARESKAKQRGREHRPAESVVVTSIYVRVLSFEVSSCFYSIISVVHASAAPKEDEIRVVKALLKF